MFSVKFHEFRFLPKFCDFFSSENWGLYTLARWSEWGPISAAKKYVVSSNYVRLIYSRWGTNQIKVTDFAQLTCSWYVKIIQPPVYEEKKPAIEVEMNWYWMFWIWYHVSSEQFLWYLIKRFLWFHCIFLFYGTGNLWFLKALFNNIYT